MFYILKLSILDIWRSSGCPTVFQGLERDVKNDFDLAFFFLLSFLETFVVTLAFLHSATERKHKTFTDTFW